jgi:hypothetical protein
MQLLKPFQVIILIIDYDTFYSNLIAQKLKEIKPTNAIEQKFDILIQKYNSDTTNVFFYNYEQNVKNKLTIAFVNQAIINKNGQFKLKKLTNTFNNLKIVLMYDEESSYTKALNSPTKRNFARITKNSFAPEVCSIIVENYLKNL